MRKILPIIKAGYLTVILLLLLDSKSSASSITNFTKSVDYVPPKDFHLRDYSMEDSTNFFSFGGPDIEFENGPEGSILFTLGPSSFDGTNADPMLPREHSELIKDFDSYFRLLGGNQSDVPSPNIGRTAGYFSISSSIISTNANNDNWYNYFCWVQIKSNIVVRIGIGTASQDSFIAATNSLQTLKINEKEILNIVKPSFR